MLARLQYAVVVAVAALVIAGLVVRGAVLSALERVRP